MQELITPSNITFALGILGVAFSVFLYFKNPQVNSEKQDALMEQKITYILKGTEQRFKDMQDNFNSLLLQSNNHIHTVDTKVDTLATNMNVMSNEITKLATIIEERMPKRTNQ